MPNEEMVGIDYTPSSITLDGIQVVLDFLGNTDHPEELQVLEKVFKGFSIAAKYKQIKVREDISAGYRDQTGKKI